MHRVVVIAVAVTAASVAAMYLAEWLNAPEAVVGVFYLLAGFGVWTLIIAGMIALVRSLSRRRRGSPDS